MTREDSKRAKPKRADLEAAERLRQKWASRPTGVTQETVAAILDSSQGNISQYLNGRIPLNFRALMAFSIAAKFDPLEVRTDLPEQQMLQVPNREAIPKNAAVRALISDIESADSAGVPELVFQQIRDMLPGVISGAVRLLSRQQQGESSINKSFGRTIDTTKEVAHVRGRSQGISKPRGDEKTRGNN